MTPVSGSLRRAKPGSASSLPDAVLHPAQFQVLVRQATALGLSNAVSAMILAIVVARVMEPRLVWGWALAVAAPTLYNAFRTFRNRDAPPPEHIRAGTRRKALFWTGLVAALWGLAPFLFFPGTTLVHHMFITLIMVGQVAGIMIALNALPAHCILFAMASQIPLVAMLLAGGSEIATALTVLIVIFNIFMGMTVWYGYRRFLDDLAIKQDLARAREEAESASRAKSQFLAVMSHELRTPLNSIIGFAEIIRRQSNAETDTVDFGKSKTAEYADYILDSGRHLLSLVSDILDLSRIESGTFSITREWVDPQELSSTVFETFRPKAQHLSLTLDLPEEDMEPIRADSRALRQILNNLLSNACKFTPDGGEVTLKLRRTDADLVIEVTDTGIGIPEDQQLEIFEPFRQADSDHARRHQGTGLGLPIVTRLAEMHGGDIRLQSQAGVGSRFTVRLPADPVEDDQSA